MESLDKMKGYIDELGKVRKRLDFFNSLFSLHFQSFEEYEKHEIALISILLGFVLCGVILMIFNFCDCVYCRWNGCVLKYVKWVQMSIN